MLFRSETRLDETSGLYYLEIYQPADNCAFGNH
jgi:hypothetical protein